MRRREFIVLLTGGAVGSPLAALAQRGECIRRISVLIPFSQSDPETQALLAAFLQRVKELGWTDGGNAHFEYRYSDGNPERTRTAAAELVGLSPHPKNTASGEPESGSYTSREFHTRIARDPRS